ncbi:hypothetical protein [Bacillus sp. FJAT-22090]|uniref:hypothetical protein n=1 Tax=Bacillus sp. FJAT-22090 TaxID=1581038 RepID=UPI0011AA8BBB|nr:hypothetical protein [Bacillus sp. FJAT-22090]
MSLSKRLYEADYVGEITCKHPLLEKGERFTIDFGRQKNEQGTWEIVSIDGAPLYLCKKVLKNGSLSESDSLNNCRKFHESVIYRAFD